MTRLQRLTDWRLSSNPAAKQGLSEQEALAKGMEAKSVEFVKQGA